MFERWRIFLRLIRQPSPGRNEQGPIPRTDGVSIRVMAWRYCCLQMTFASATSLPARGPDRCLRHGRPSLDISTP